MPRIKPRVTPETSLERLRRWIRKEIESQLQQHGILPPCNGYNNMDSKRTESAWTPPWEGEGPPYQGNDKNGNFSYRGPHEVNPFPAMPDQHPPHISDLPESPGSNRSTRPSRPHAPAKRRTLTRRRRTNL
jgi:hypothetical protein